MKNKNNSHPQTAAPVDHSHTQLTELLAEVKTLFLQKWEELSICPDWIPKSVVQKYLDYGDTQFSTLVLAGDLVTAKVGRRVFVSRQSIMALLERNVQK